VVCYRFIWLVSVVTFVILGLSVVAGIFLPSAILASGAVPVSNNHAERKKRGSEAYVDESPSAYWEHATRYTTVAAPPAEANREIKRVAKPCRDFQRSACRYGSMCRYSHEIS
jgi:CCCH-type zinc finger